MLEKTLEEEIKKIDFKVENASKCVMCKKDVLLLKNNSVVPATSINGDKTV